MNEELGKFMIYECVCREKEKSKYRSSDGDVGSKKSKVEDTQKH